MKSSPIIKIWMRIIDTGKRDDLSFLDSMRLRVINGAVVLLSLSQVLIIGLHLIEDERLTYASIFNFLIALLPLPILALNRKQFYVAAKLVFVVSFLLLVVSIGWGHAIAGRNTETEIILLAAALFSVLMFDGALKYVMYALIFCSYNFLKVMEIKNTQDHSLWNLDKLFNPALTFIAIFLIASLYRWAYNKSQQTILLKNEELLRKNDRIEMQAKNLEELNLQKDKLFSVISHDLRGPMNSLTTMMTMVEKEWISESDFKQQLPALSKNMKVTSSLLNNLLLWSRSQMKGYVQQKKTFRILDLVNVELNLLEIQASEKGITLSSGVNEQHTAYADPNMVTIIIRNLVVNAIKFSQQNSTVLIDSHHQGQETVVQVKDQGVGISPDRASRLFDLGNFSTPGTSQEKGTGLGLMLCKDFTEKNGGRIWVESELNKGTSFYFTLPIAIGTNAI